jgi:selenocysteine-specific elongation factor
LPREEARERIVGTSPSALFDHVLATLTTEGKLTGRDRLSLPGRGVSLTSEEARAKEALEQAYRDAGLATADVASVATAAKVSPTIADRVVRLLVRQGVLVKLDTLIFHSDALAKLKQDVKALKTEGGAAAAVDVPSFKARYGLSRKYAIPLLEWLDRERITRRVGDSRIVV